MSKARIPLDKAEWIAEKIKGAIGEHCDKVAIAGSIRRKEPVVGDIEIVCQPKMKTTRDLFGDPHRDAVVSLEKIKRDLGDLGLHKVKGKDRYQQWEIPYTVSGLIEQELSLDLFLVLPPADWGVIFMIRTGPHFFSRKMVTQKPSGYLPRGCQVLEGRIVSVLNENKVKDIDTEKDYFKFCGMDYIPPEERQHAELAK